MAETDSEMIAKPKKQQSKPIMAGDVFGQWTATGRHKTNASGKTVWEMICSCHESTSYIQATRLRHGHSQRCRKCGHLSRRITFCNLPDEHGLRTATGIRVRKNNNLFIEMKCVCGNVNLVNARLITEGKSLSCVRCCATRNGQPMTCVICHQPGHMFASSLVCSPDVLICCNCRFSRLSLLFSHAFQILIDEGVLHREDVQRVLDQAKEFDSERKKKRV